jgi:dienelactone hydrolase
MPKSLAAVAAATVAALAIAAPPAFAGETPEPVTAHGLVAEVYTPAGPAIRHPAILVIGGSEGGLEGASGEARLLAKQGYVTMALAYFAAPGLPEQLTNLPLEYFGTALDALRARPDVDPKRVGLIGTSKGGEGALLIASKYPEVKVVVVGVPSSVAWQGINTKNYADPSGSWTEKGKPVPFLPYDASGGFDPSNFMKSIHDMYALSLTKVDAHPDAVIAVERIDGPVMLVCGESDALWPSCPMSQAVAARLKAKGFKHQVRLLAYPNAGHAAFGPPVPADSPRVGQFPMYGGDIPGNLAARADGWAQATAFLAAALKP